MTKPTEPSKLFHKLSHPLVFWIPTGLPVFFPKTHQIPLHVGDFPPESFSSCHSPPRCVTSHCSFISLLFLQVSQLGLSAQQFSQGPEPRSGSRAGLCVLVLVSLLQGGNFGRTHPASQNLTSARGRARITTGKGGQKPPCWRCQNINQNYCT